ncbi:MAG: LysM peptidoglycan-binding domain-containing protein [Firmicutes bacterium]|nr:LysM peptidoglycan-binding domain-containing protein [Bacillota bacterium]
MDYRIVVDAGHGGSDPGAVSGNLRESDFNLKAALYMYNRFKELGVPVTITRDTDRTLTRSERLNTMRNSFGTDPNVIILSNHINAGGGEGAEIVYPLRSSEVLPKAILEAIGEEGQIMRKVYQRVLPEDTSKDYYYIMRETPNTTSLLIEYGFIDNPNDVVKLQNNLEDYAEAVVRAVANYIGVQYVAPNGEVIDENTYIVKRGDTLYSIARLFNVSVDELRRLNNIVGNNLSIGQVLLIPNIDVDNDNSNSNNDTDSNNSYVVVSGDNLYNIALKYGVSVVDLINLNNLSSTVVIPGQVLLIPNKESTTYTVKRGDTLYGIASSYGVSIDEIKSLNNLTSNTLSIGQELLIPTSNTITETNYEVYTVVSGDTLYGIANKYGVSVDDIKTLNNLTSNTLSIGQRLQIPLKEVTSSNFVYTVKRGDTLYGIASSFGLNVIDLINLNNLGSTNLFIGQELLIPQK